MSFISATHYIDPGTGSMLFTLVIGLLSAGYFFLKRLIINMKFFLSGGSARNESGEKLPYVIFAESERYWNVFEPICDEFERRGIDLEYWTASENDPVFAKPYTHVHPSSIGEGNRAFAKLNMMSACICLATTPGLDVYQWKRSKDVDWYVHTFHTTGTSVGYHMFGIDYFDAVLMGGPFMEHEVRTLERKRELPPKELELVGVTYMDSMLERVKGTPRPQNARPVVLLAPTWGKSGILSVYGKRIIDCLLDTGFEIVVRPHPQSRVSDKEILDDLMRTYPDGSDISWNFDNDNFDVLNRADIMITDFSGVIFDYTLIFDKPVIYTEGNFDDSIYDACWLDEPQWRFSVFPKLGIPLKEEQFDHMREVIESVMRSEDLNIGRDEARREAWAYRGEAAQRTVDYLVRKHAELTKPEEIESTAD